MKRFSSEFLSLQYLSSKEPDLGDECFVFKTYGRCGRGVTCRFAASHITRDAENRIRNKVDQDLAQKFGSLRVRERNHLDKDLQVPQFVLIRTGPMQLSPSKLVLVFFGI